MYPGITNTMHKSGFFSFCLKFIQFCLLFQKKKKQKKIGLLLRNQNLRIHLMNLSVSNKQLCHAPALGKCTLELNWKARIYVRFHQIQWTISFFLAVYFNFILIKFHVPVCWNEVIDNGLATAKRIHTSLHSWTGYSLQNVNHFSQCLF